MLKPFQSFRRNRALDLRTFGKAESEKLPFLRSRYRALRLIHLEFELLRDESRDAFHHPLTRALAANVDVAVVRVANISDVLGAPTHGRVRRARGWTTAEKVDPLVEYRSWPIT